MKYRREEFPLQICGLRQCLRRQATCPCPATMEKAPEALGPAEETPEEGKGRKITTKRSR